MLFGFSGILITLGGVNEIQSGRKRLKKAIIRKFSWILHAPLRQSPSSVKLHPAPSVCQEVRLYSLVSKGRGTLKS